MKYDCLTICRLRFQGTLSSFCSLNQNFKNPVFFYLNSSKKIQILRVLRTSCTPYSTCKTGEISVKEHYNKSKSFLERLRHLMRQYGIVGAYVYFSICLIDFGISLALVKSLGTTTIGFYEKKIISKIENFTGWRPKNNRISLSENKENEKNTEASIWAEIAIAYGIHKLLIFVRVPLTAVFTPPLVRLLIRQGWSISKHLKK
ncbi:hypothetical protein T552_03291 [Pneumocystis carinii B80]|uniref:DUF1279 domain-containing protein n=1 Tax=Pneumocystis carinii (strain B80) TaxID=1408658 RepID=A0A0W4ZCI5_PNEC8|nr:hypothetical protein T552_03291 [Pneumocystis carinii B80]KTW26021.1 hypothetical protein T552_03291 [Pneumocystis carinii B80]